MIANKVIMHRFIGHRKGEIVKIILTHIRNKLALSIKYTLQNKKCYQ